MALFFARFCLVAAGIWLASAGNTTPNITRPHMAAGQGTSNHTGRRMAARQNTSSTAGEPMALASAGAAESAEAFMKSEADLEARVNLINSSLQLATESRQRAVAEIAQAAEERERRRWELDTARADLEKAKEEFVESTRDSIHGTSGGHAKSMADADEAVVDAEARVRDALRGTRHATERTAVAVQHAMEAEAHAKVMEFEFSSNASSLEREVREMNTSLGAQRLHELAVLARLVPEENATEEGAMPHLNETIKRMEMALREARGRWTRARRHADRMATKEKRMQKKDTVVANHTRARKAHQDSEVAQPDKTAGVPQQKDMKTVQTTKHRIQHTAEVMGKANSTSEAVREHRNVATTKATGTKQQGEGMEHAAQPAPRVGKRLRARK